MNGFNTAVVLSGNAPLPIVPASSKPLPVPYREAVKALEKCRTLDEAIYWDNASDALAAWAKIYADDTVSNEARALKLHAYRRIGVLAGRLQPGSGGDGSGGKPGPFKLLREHGFNSHQAAAARKLSKISQPDFEKLAAAKRPPSPLTAHVTKLRGDHDFVAYRRAMQSLMPVLRRVRPKQMGKFVAGKNASRLASDAIEIAEWLQDFSAVISAHPRDDAA